QAGGVMINKEKLENFDDVVSTSHLIAGKYIIAQKGKKNYFLLIAK
ncbi:MAG: tyrosine--tRNA ligase, partial [Prevotella sp.]|nr:tyrosine--tRNA ligase [Prevotella sp.]